MMNFYQFPKFLATLAFTVFFTCQSVGQISPYFATEESSETIEWFWSKNGEGVGEIFKLGKVIQDSGDGASVTERIRVSVMIMEDYDCTQGNCPGDGYFENNLKYSLDGTNYQEIFKASTSQLPGWNVIGTVEAYDSYSNPYQTSYQEEYSYDCGLFGWGTCWAWRTVYVDHAYTGNNGFTLYGYTKSGINTSNVHHTTNGNYHTLTFDWTNFPKEILDDDCYFQHYTSVKNENFYPDFGTLTSIPNLETESNDFGVDLVGTGGVLPGCHNNSNYKTRWLAESFAIYGDNQPHEVEHGDWLAEDFNFPVFTASGDGQLGPDLSISYKLTYQEYDRGCAIQRIFNDSSSPSAPLLLETNSLPDVDNIIAQNIDTDNDEPSGNPMSNQDYKDHVSIEWSHITAAEPNHLLYNIYRKDNPSATEKKIYETFFISGTPKYKNHTLAEFQAISVVTSSYDDDHYIIPLSGDYEGLKGRFIDYSADVNKTYLYRIEVKVVTELVNSPFQDMIIGTGAGIEFFNDNETLDIETPKPLCGEFSIEGSQEIINELVRFSNENYIFNVDDNKLSFVDMTLDSDNFSTAVQSQRVYFYQDPLLSETVQYTNDDDELVPLELSGSQTDIDAFVLPLEDDVEQTSMYAVIRATRTDGKVFQSFEPKAILGMRKPTPPAINISSATFEDFVTLRFTDIKDENNIDNLKIFRESREPSNGASPATDEGASFDEDVVVESIILDKDFIENMIVENGQIVFYDDISVDGIGWSQTILCNEYTYYIESSNCDIWSAEDAAPLTFTRVVGNSMQVSPTLQEDLFEVGNPSRDLSASRGEYPHKVHLTWNNNSSGVIDHYTVERRQFGHVGESAWVEIGAVSTGEKYFEDSYAEANLLYEYRIKAHVGNCASTSPNDPGTQANTVSSSLIGFRRPVGRVTGRIVYNQTSNPVEDVYVKVEPIINDDQTNNRSLDLSGSYGIIDRPFQTLEGDDLEAYTVNFWMKPASNNEGYLFSRYSELHHSDLIFYNNQVRYEEFATSYADAETPASLKEENYEWNNVVMTVSDSVRLYLNGQAVGTYNSSFEESKNNSFRFGGNGTTGTSFDGLMDEIVVWKRALSAEEISNNYYKFLSTSDNDLVLFITGDEGLGNTSFDVSSNLIDVFNKNHLNLFEDGTNQNYSNPEGVDYFFSDLFNEELLNLGKSTSSGMYDITDVRYIFDGNNFSITPYTLTEYTISHEFMPAQRTNFIGDQTSLLSAIDFSDLTSKTVQGKVLFDVTALTTRKFAGDGVTIIDGFDLIDKESDPIGVDDVFVKLNGKRVQGDDGEVKTDADGAFSLSVPIGTQCISFEKHGHTFFYLDDFNSDQSKRGKHCQDFDFGTDANLPDFSCNTYKELRGRISGGQRYNSQLIDDIVIGFNQSANTIGSVGFTIIPNDASTNDYDGYSASVETDPLTGEYSALLLPIAHKINSASWISSNKDVENYYQDQQYLFPTIDMKVEGENDANGDFVEDVLTTSSQGIQVETIEYNTRFDITYRNNPSILVHQNISTEQNWSESIGEKLIKIDQDFFLTAYDSTGYSLGIPIFKEKYVDQTYRYSLEVSEVYTNYGPIIEGHNFDSHNSYMYKGQDGKSVYDDTKYYNPVEVGQLTINNTMLDNSSKIVDLSDLDSSIDYEFNPDNPYVFGVDQNFIRKFIIVYQEGTINAKWPELSTGQTESQRGNVMLFGDESYGNDFFTFGPQSVDMILRDPSGDASFSSISQGSTVSRTSTISNVNGYTKDYSFHLGAGLRFETEAGFSFGAHFATMLSGQAFVTIDQTNSASLSNTSENEITISDTYNQTVSTNAGDFEVGGAGDVFLGESKNLNFGTAKDLKFILSSDCFPVNPIFTCTNEHVIKEFKSFKRQYEILSNGDTSLVIEFDVNASYEVLSDQFEDTEEIVSDSIYSQDGHDYFIQEFQSNRSYSIGTKTKADIKPGVSTKFGYSQNYIENYMIPKLLMIKNTYLYGVYSPDTDLVPQDHACFGEPTISACFDTIPEKRYYYVVPESETAQSYEIPVLSNYDVNTLTNILGTTYTEFQENFAEASNSINYTVSDDAINNNHWNNPLFAINDESTGAFNYTTEISTKLFDFLDFVNTGITFGLDQSITGSYASEDNLADLINQFASQQDFTSVPGFLDLSNMINGLTLNAPDASTESIIIPKDKVQFYSQQIKLWERAMAMNELDKIESEFITNHSISGGLSIEQSHTSTGNYTNTTSMNYQLGAMDGLGGDFEAVIFFLGFEADFSYNNTYSVEYNQSTTLSSGTETTTLYSLSDDDQGDAMSIDVSESKYGYGPIFSLQAGATSCPWEDALYAKYITNFDLYFELKFYTAFMELGGNLPTNLTFNTLNYDFSFDGLLSELDGVSESPLKKATWIDYTQLNQKAIKSPFETARFTVYSTVKQLLLNEHTAIFGGSSNYQLSATSSRRDVPVLSVTPLDLFNVPEEAQAVFSLVLGNESEDNSARIYNIRVLESSNPYGAILKIDGASPNRDFPVPAGGIVNKTLTVEKGPDSLNYENLQLIIYPECQYDQGTSDEYHIADTISINVYFLPTCTDITVSDNDDDWLVNISDSNLVSLNLNSYNINYYSLEDIYVDYKFENEPWSPISPNPSIVNPNYVLNKLESFKRLNSLEFYNLLHSDFDITNWNLNELYHKLEPKEFCVGCSYATYEPTQMNMNDLWILWKEVSDTTTFIHDEISRLKDKHLSSEFANSDSEMLSLRTSSTNILWNVPMLPKDGNYKIRVKSKCGTYDSQTSGASEDISVYSSTHDVFSDRIRPELFGSIQPTDGILNPNDDVIITFNETINEIAFNTSSAQTFVEVESRKNRTTHTHDSYLYFGANDSLVIPSGVYLNQSFTIEMWLKPESNGILFEQSNGEDSEMIKLSIIDFDSTPKLKFDYIHPSEVDKNQTAIHSMVLSSFGFTHIAIAYDAENNQIIFLDGTGEVNIPEYNFNMNYVGDGPILVGTDYQGGMHDLRLWNKIALNIEANRSISLSGQEANLVGYWPMDELLLNPKDKSRYRHALTSAQWTVDSDNTSLVFNQVLEGSTDYVPFEDPIPTSIQNNSDFTIEFWFNSDQTENQTLISLGAWNDGSNFESWSIDLNSGLVQVFQGGDDNINPILSSFNSLNDGGWHHFAMVKNSSSNTRLYIDGNEVDDVSSDLIGGITASSTFFGVRKSVNSVDNSTNYLNHFNGYMDEFRIWNIAKSNDRISSEMNSSISEKIGLLRSLDFNNVAINELTSETNIPLIRASESKTSVSFHDVSNGNQISIQITEPLNMIENTSLDFTIQNIKDVSGNFIENPISWSTFIDRNQLIWQTESIQKEKLLGEPLTFVSHIINQGGAVEDFQITNLPVWLTANPSQGLLEPNSFTLVEFVVNADLFIGDYKEDLLLIGNNNYGERLEFSLNVEMPQPDYSVNVQDYEYVMNFVGKVTVEGIRSRDDKDILFAYVGDELRGASSPIYIEEYDSYFIFLSVYGNQVTGEEISFRLWDASEGKFQSRVKVNNLDTHDFQPSFVIGSFTDLAHFEATNILRQDIVLEEGWNWLSFNLNSLDENDGLDHILQIPTVMNQVDGSSVSIFKNQSGFTQYADIEGYPNLWIGSLTELPVTDMYMIKSETADTIVYEGKIINPSDVTIDVGIGWNWIGYLGQRIMSTNEALSSLNPTSGDVIKNKSSFSMFASESLGWLGTLNSMESGEGYMLKTGSSGSLIYPESSIYRAHDYKQSNNQFADNLLPVRTSFYEHSMSLVAKIDLQEYNQPSLSNVLAAFSDDFCLGNINATVISEDESLYFITIYGEEGYDISFKYYDQNKELYFTTENMITFEPNKLIGSVIDPYLITLSNPIKDNTNTISIYPNPFEDEFEIELFLENQDYITIDIYDVVGRKVSSIYEGLFDSGIHKIKIDATDIAKGSYFIELKLKDSSTRKTIIKS